jgi:hypothetical protein
MAFEATTMLDLLVLLIWTCCENASWNQTAFRFAMKSKPLLHALLSSAGLAYCPGLFEAVQSTSPPPLSWFLSRTTPFPTKTWGVYLIVLEKEGHRPITYIGSGTAADRGIRARMNSYDTNSLLSTYVQQAIFDDKYSITHKMLLVSCPIPAAGRIPLVRTALKGVEAVLSCVLSTFHNPDKHYGFHDLFPWPRSSHSFEYDGSCTHSPFFEVDENIQLPPEELEAVAADKKEKERVYIDAYHREKRANPTEQYKATHNNNNKKQAPKTKARQQEAVATKR